MEFLKFLQSIRNPVLDGFFSIVTMLGEETVFILVGLIFFWCISKKQGYYLLTIGFVGTVLNQFLKLLFRIPRPWVQDPTFKIVESAREQATGYSFPSGHTQTAVGIFGGIARITKNKAFRIICIIICILVPISRMYLGVHTPLDVGVSFVLAIVMVFMLYPLINKAMESKKGMRTFLFSMIAVSVAYLLFVELFPFPCDIDAQNYASGVKNAYKILGCILGLWLGYELDERIVHFDTKAVWWAQILKFALGLIPVIFVKSVLKEPINAIFGGAYVADAVRYFLLTFVAAGVWPMTFKFFSKLGTKKQ